MAAILNRPGRSTEKAVLERLDAQDPELAEEVQLRVVQTARQLEEAGQVTILRGGHQRYVRMSSQ